MYELDKFSLGDCHKEWLTYELGKELKNIHDMNILNDMNFAYDNKVNNIYEWNLLHNIINPYKCTKYINIYHSPILCGCVNTRGGREEYKNSNIIR